jgi:hypothetical protein
VSRLINEFNASVSYLEQREVDLLAALNAAADRIAERDTTIAAKDAEIAVAGQAKLAAEQQVAVLTVTLSDKDEAIAGLTDNLSAANAEIARLTALLNPAPRFTVYNEMKSVPSLPRTPIRFIYENELIAPGETRLMPPNVDHLRSKFAQIKANEPETTMVVLDQEGWLPTGSGASQIAHPEYYVTLLNVAREFWSDVSVYSYPKRYYGFVTGSAAENVTRYNTLVVHTQETQQITDLCTFLCPSFYVPTAIEDDADRAAWMNGYFDLCELVAPGKAIIPTLWPRFHTHPADWLTGPIWDDMIRRIHARPSCKGYIIFGRSGGDDPDPRPLNLPWWQADEALTAERLA